MERKIFAINKKSTHILETGATNWVLYKKTTQVKKDEYSDKINLSINVRTHEVHCNRTGRNTKTLRTFLNKTVALEELFTLSSILDFANLD